MPDPITSTTIRNWYTKLIKNTVLDPEAKMALFVASIDSSATINDILKTEIEWCLFHLNAQTNNANTNNQTGSELFKIHFPYLKIEENVASEVSYIEADDAIIIKRRENRLAAPAIKSNREEREEAILAYNQAMIDQGPLHQILIELGMTQKDFDNDFQFKYLLKEMYTSQTFFYNNHKGWMENLESYSRYNLDANNEKIIFILKASELMLAEHPNKRELMLKLYLSIIAGSLIKTKHNYNDNDYLPLKNQMMLKFNNIFKDDYPDIYNTATEIFNDIISDKRFKDIINLHKKLNIFKNITYPRYDAYNVRSNIENHLLFQIHNLLVLIVLILSFTNILPMIPAIVVLGSYGSILNVAFNYKIYSNFKKEFSMFDNTGRTTKTFIKNLIFTTLLIIATTSVFVSLVLKSYPMLALFTGAFCMWLSLSSSVYFSPDCYEKLSESIIKNHRDEKEQDKLEYTKLIDDFIRNPNSSSPSKTSTDHGQETSGNNSLALVEDNLLFGGSKQTGNPSFNKGFRSPK